MRIVNVNYPSCPVHCFLFTLCFCGYFFILQTLELFCHSSFNLFLAQIFICIAAFSSLCYRSVMIFIDLSNINYMLLLIQGINLIALYFLRYPSSLSDRLLSFDYRASKCQTKAQKLYLLIIFLKNMQLFNVHRTSYYHLLFWKCCFSIVTVRISVNLKLYP